MQQLEITRPDDCHVHLRDGLYLKQTVVDSSRYFHRAVVMPNLLEPVTTVALALEYKKRLLAHCPEPKRWQPLMLLYLTDSTSVRDVVDVAASEACLGFKLYPANATTNSSLGVTSVKKMYPLLEAMQKHDVPLLIHGEVTDAEVDVFDREAVFIEKILAPLIKTFPDLRVVLEHITTQSAVDFVLSVADNVAATITPHHLWLNRNDMLAGGIRPHYFCLPILKRQQHQQALIKAAISGNKKFFLGTDSAPHARINKESDCGCAGIYSAHAALELYAEVFAQNDALDKLEGFASFYGADFYGLPRNTDKVILSKESWAVPAEISFGDQTLIPFHADQLLAWKVVTK